MAVPWGWVVFFVGIAYGYMKKGRQDKTAIFKTGAIWGLIAAVVISVVGYVADVNPLGIGAGTLALFIGFIIWTLLFVLGVFVGDWLEHRGSPSH